MKSKGTAIVAALLAVFGVWLWLGKNPALPPTGKTASEVAKSNQPPLQTPQASNTREQALRSAAGKLAAAQSADERKDALVHLRETIATGSTIEVVAAMRALLESRTDASTGQGFKIGGGGSLLEAPTLRTWLLDQLGQLDPAAAAA